MSGTEGKYAKEDTCTSDSYLRGDPSFFGIVGQALGHLKTGKITDWLPSYSQPYPNLNNQNVWLDKNLMIL